MMAGKQNGPAKGRGLSRRATAALMCSLLAGTGVVASASPAAAAVDPVTPPHDIGVFPMRDFLGIGGWGVGAEMDVRVIRDGVQIGSAGPMTLAADLELNGFAEVNHPGGVCWNGVTPNIVAGDRIEAVDADGNGEFTIVQNVEVTQPATKVDADNDGAADDIIARGMAADVAGTGRIDPGLVEQRVINPDLKNTTIGRRDVRAIFGTGPADGVETRGRITWDDPTSSTDPHWTATYLNLGEDIATMVADGQSRMLAWERTNTAGDRIGMTLWEYGEVGGPGMGGCPASADYSVGGANPKSINTLTQGQPSLTLTGTAYNVDTVTVSVDDHSPATAPVTATATVAKPASLDTGVALPGNTTWSASLPMPELKSLNDDTLVASATYGLVQETTDPATAAKTRTSSPIGGANLNILKDLTVPVAPTAFPGSGRYPTTQSVTISPDNEIEDTVRYRVGATPTATADPTAVSPVAPTPLSVTTTQTVKARSFDPAGNPSALATFEYTIAPLGVPGAPTGVTATAGNASATVSWTPNADDGGSPITGYVVETYRGTAFVKQDSIPSTVTSAVIGSLANGTAYNFKVRAVNAQGQSLPSAASAPVTPAGTGGTNVPPTVTAQSPAAGATGVAVASNVTATFSEPVTGVTAARFTLRQGTADTGTLVGRAFTYNATTRTATLNPNANLLANTVYTARLLTGITDTAGAPLAPVTWSFTTGVAAATVPARPAIGTAVAGVAGGAITATANWSAPTSDGGSPITGYRVRALRISSTGAVLATTVSAVQPGTSRSLSMTLPVTGNYRFTVQAVNAVGDSVQSARSNLVAGR